MVAIRWRYRPSHKVRHGKECFKTSRAGRGAGRGREREKEAIGVAERDVSHSHHRHHHHAALEHKLVRRMKRDDLISRNILQRGDVSAAVLERQKALVRSRIQARLKRTFRTRPSMEKLQESNIMPANKLSPSHLEAQKRLEKRQRLQLLSSRLARRPSINVLREKDIMPVVAVNPRTNTDDEFLEESVYPVLDAAVEALLKALASNAQKRNAGVANVKPINPINWLAQHLMRTNPRYNKTYYKHAKQSPST